MELWVPRSVGKDRIRESIQTWLDDTTKHAYQNIIQDRVNSLYPRFGETKTLYIMTVTPQRVVTIENDVSVPDQPSPAAKFCAICHEEDSVVRHTLVCNHRFHLHCIERWLRSHNTCPMCRRRVVGIY